MISWLILAEAAALTAGISRIRASRVSAVGMSTYEEYLRSKQGGAASPAPSPEAPKVSFDNDMAGWKPQGGGSGAHAMGGDASKFVGTDTPDFLPEEGSELEALAKGVSYADGMMGSQSDPNRKKSSGPELAGALDSDPDIYVPEVEEIVADASDFVLPEPSWKVSRMAVSATDDEFEMFTGATETRALEIAVKPVCMTFEDFYCGFTADSHPSFSVTPTTGKMERRNGPPTTVKVTCNPQGAAGDLVGHLCFILPEEKDFSTYYKITCTSR
jgi:hypothetical protein